MNWRPKIFRGGAHKLRAAVACGYCGKPIEKGMAKATQLWTRGKEGCTTRRHRDCDEKAIAACANGFGYPSEAEIAEHKRRQEGR